MANLNNLLRSIQDEELLTKYQEKELGEIIQSSSSSEKEKNEAINIFVIKNIYLVLKFSHKYRRKEFEFEDIVGYGILGLFRAAQKYDPSKNNRFASYARYWIKDAIVKALREYSGLPKIPVYLVRDLWAVSRTLSKHDNCDNYTLAKLTNISIENAKYLRSLLFKTVQFDNAYSKEDPNTPEDLFEQKERRELIKVRLREILSEDEFRVLAHTHGLFDFRKMTFTELSKQIENPRKLKASAIKKLKKDETLLLLYKECIV